jgi:hypothetical protein
VRSHPGRAEYHPGPLREKPLQLRQRPGVQHIVLREPAALRLADAVLQVVEFQRGARWSSG